MKKIILLLLTIFFIGCADPVISSMYTAPEVEEPDPEVERDIRLSGFWEDSNRTIGFKFAPSVGSSSYYVPGGKELNRMTFYTEDGYLYLHYTETGNDYLYSYRVHYNGHLNPYNILYLTKLGDNPIPEKAYYQTVY